MARETEKKDFAKADEVRVFPKGKVEMITIGGGKSRSIFVTSGTGKILFCRNKRDTPLPSPDQVRRERVQPCQGSRLDSSPRTFRITCRLNVTLWYRLLRAIDRFSDFSHRNHPIRIQESVQLQGFTQGPCKCVTSESIADRRESYGKDQGKGGSCVPARTAEKLDSQFSQSLQ